MIAVVREMLLRYWEDIILLGAMAAIAAAIVIIHLIERSRKRRNNAHDNADDAGYESPPFKVEYGPAAEEDKEDS